MKKINIFILLLFIIYFNFSCVKIRDNSSNFEDKADSINNINKDQKNIDLQKQLHLIAQNGTSSVVFISTERSIIQKYFDLYDFFFRKPGDLNPEEREFKQTALGSGIIYRRDRNKYYIITNNHVIDKANKIKVATDKNKIYKANIIGSDPNVDIAIIKIKTSDNLNIAQIGNSDSIQVGDFVTAVGNPFNLNFTMTFGIISAIGRSNIYNDKITLTDFIQTDTAINPGNSGGPLLNIFGEVIGINTLIYSQTGENIGIGFAIPINIVRETADQLIKNGKIEHGFIGIYYKELTEEDIKILELKSVKHGMLVTEIFKNSPAEKYGIKVGDIITKLNDNIIINSRDLAMKIGKLSPGTKVILEIYRDNKYIKKEIILSRRKNK